MALLRLSGWMCLQLFEPTHHCLISQLAPNTRSKPSTDNHRAVDRSSLSGGFIVRSAGFNGSLMLQKISATPLTSLWSFTASALFYSHGLYGASIFKACSVLASSVIYWESDQLMRTSVHAPNMVSHSFQWKLLGQHCKSNNFFASYLCV